MQWPHLATGKVSLHANCNSYNSKELYLAPGPETRFNEISSHVKGGCLGIIDEGCEMHDLGKGLRGTRIECRQGRCWRPHAADSRDHILGASKGIQGLRRRDDRLNGLRNHCDWNCLSR